MKISFIVNRHLKGMDIFFFVFFIAFNKYFVLN